MLWFKWIEAYCMLLMCVYLCWNLWKPFMEITNIVSDGDLIYISCDELHLLMWFNSEHVLLWMLLLLSVLRTAFMKFINRIYWLLLFKNEKQNCCFHCKQLYLQDFINSGTPLVMTATFIPVGNLKWPHARYCITNSCRLHNHALKIQT